MADLAYGEVYTMTRTKGIQGMSPVWGRSRGRDLSPARTHEAGEPIPE